MATQTVNQRGLKAQPQLSFELPVTTFKVGDTCTLFDGHVVTILEEYEIKEYRDVDTNEQLVRACYKISWPGQGEFYCAAGYLRAMDGQVHHLQLVRPPAPPVKKTRSPSAAAARKAFVDLVKACDASQAMSVIQIVSKGAEGLERRLKDALRFGEINETQAEMARALAIRIGLTTEAQEVAHV